jgi:protein-disulfide isomerase
MRALMHTLSRSSLPALVAASALVLLACNKERTAGSTSAASGGSSSQDGNAVVATYAGKSMTLKELDDKISDKVFELRQQALEQAVTEDLVQMEAKKRNMTEEEFLKAEIQGKVTQPSDEEMQKFWEQVKSSGQVPAGTNFEDVKDRIAANLTREPSMKRAQELFKELKEKANYQAKLMPPKKEVAATGPARGPDNAPVTIVEFSDFQCPFCSRAAETVHQVMDAYPGKVRLVFRHFPLAFHKQAPKAGEAAVCANEQGKFWEYHDALFKAQDKLMPDDLKAHAKAVGMDEKKFNECLDSGKQAEVVKKDMEAGQKVGVSGTPAFFINGVMLSGAQPIEEFKKVIDAELEAKK